MKGKSEFSCARCKRIQVSNRNLLKHQGKCLKKPKLEVKDIIHLMFTFDRKLFMCQMGCGFTSNSVAEMAKHLLSSYSE